MSVLDRFKLDGDVALVTGAAGGIGSAFAEGMVEAGANVALADVDVEGLDSVAADLRSNTDAEVLAIDCDVSDEDAVDEAVDETVAELGGLDVAFANAGISTSVGSVTYADMRQWHDLLDVNLTGVFHTDKAAGAYMKANDGGKIVNTASILGFKGSQIPGQVAYCAAKGGVVQVTRQLAAELGPHDVRVNAIAPGWIDTDMTGGLGPGPGAGAGGAASAGSGGDDGRSQLANRLAIKRGGTPDDLKGTAVYLASDASPYTTGEIILVDGGMYAMG